MADVPVTSSAMWSAPLALASLGALVASSSNAPLDWVYGTVASIIFVAAVAIPAALLNSREHKRRQRERSAQ
jgi:hypothetical protein